jgi:hypothetical protein
MKVMKSVSADTVSNNALRPKNCSYSANVGTNLDNTKKRPLHTACSGVLLSSKKARTGSTCKVSPTRRAQEVQKKFEDSERDIRGDICKLECDSARSLLLKKIETSKRKLDDKKAKNCKIKKQKLEELH